MDLAYGKHANKFLANALFPCHFTNGSIVLSTSFLTLPKYYHHKHKQRYRYRKIRGTTTAAE